MKHNISCTMISELFTFILYQRLSLKQLMNKPRQTSKMEFDKQIVSMILKGKT